jgi:BirA family biotin operon repressor/biotin-[acetyl-CoA-carboxylase] ligase
VPRVRRREQFGAVPSTNDVVRDWLAAGQPEICVAVADEQTAGRGRNGRTWSAPAGAGLLVSLGFRPVWLPPDRVWRLAAIASLAMADAAEASAGLSAGTVLLKWPNDLVAAADDPAELRKLGGVLGETDGLGTSDPRAVVGLGVNGDWPAAEFPSDLADAMTSLRELAGDRSIDSAALLEAFLSRLEARVDDLHAGRFDADGWAGRQATTGQAIELAMPDGATRSVTGRGVDPESGALRFDDPTTPGRERSVVVGEIRRVRLVRV